MKEDIATDASKITRVLRYNYEQLLLGNFIEILILGSMPDALNQKLQRLTQIWVLTSVKATVMESRI